MTPQANLFHIECNPIIHSLSIDDDILSTLVLLRCQCFIRGNNFRNPHQIIIRDGNLATQDFFGTSVTLDSVTDGTVIQCVPVGFVNGDTHIEGSKEVDGNSTIHGSQTVDGDSYIKGSETVDKNLTVNGDSHIKGNSTTDGNSTVGGNLLVNGTSEFSSDAAFDKNVHVKGSQETDGDATIHGNATIDKKLTVGDDATFGKNVTVNGITSTGALISRGDAAIGGNTHAYGDLVLDGKFFAKGAATFGDKVDIAKDLTVGGDTHIGGNATVDGDIYGRSFNVGNERYIDKNGVNANGHAVRNVADGAIAASSKDAVNGGQLYDAYRVIDYVASKTTSNISQLKSHLTSDINKVGAGAAAMANLHPMEYKRNDKVSVAAAVGNYKDTTAMAVGAFYRPDAKSMVSVSGSIGSNNNMVGFGYSQRFGQTSEIDGMTEDELRNAVGELKESNKMLSSRLAQTEARNKVVEQENNALGKRATTAEQKLAELTAKVESLTARLDSISSAKN